MGMTAAVITSGRPARPSQARRLLVPITLAVIALATGWVVARWEGASSPVAVIGQLQGTVTSVNGPGSKVCLDVQSTQHCGRLYDTRDAPTIAVGDSLSIAVVQLPLGGGGTEEVFLIVGR
jgi:hypothetical protein